MTIETAVIAGSRLYASNQTETSITAPTATTTEPSGEGYVRMKEAGSSLVEIILFGTTTADTTITARVSGWRLIGDLWTPAVICTLTGTIGTFTGVSGASITNSEKFCDTITGTFYASGYDLSSPADNTVARVVVDALGCAYIGVQVARGDSATANATARRI